MKKLLLSFFLIALTNSLLAEPIDSLIAKDVATNYIQSHLGISSVDLQLVNLKTSNNQRYSASEPSLLYAFKFKNSDGFIFLSGDDHATPILGYSLESSFDHNNLPPSLRKWLEGYKKQLREIQFSNIEPTQEIEQLWKDLKQNKIEGQTRSSRSVSPLISTKWDQSPYVNELCPGGSVTGCVATAMAQIMKYWDYPQQGSGFHSYFEDDYGMLSVNFGAATYDWVSMPDYVNAPNNAVATLMFHCGVSVDMNYSPQSSGAAGAIKVAPSLKTYFNYDASTSIASRVNYADAQWLNLLKNELDAGRPLYYEGFGGGSGHAFICDGYDNNNFFHFNWGWGGISDGYFTVNALNPGNLGTGGGSGGFNSNQKVVYAIKPPPNAITYDLELNDDVEASSNTIFYGQAFDITTNILNDGTNSFSGDFCAAIFDANSNFIDYVEINSGLSLPSGYTYNNGITFSTTGMFNLLPGSYTIGIYYRPTGGNWIMVEDDWFYSNYEQITVVNPNDLELNSDIVVANGTTVTQGQSLSVNLNILNDGSSTFIGDYSVDLYSLNGDWIEEIGIFSEQNGLPSGYTYNSPINFSSNSITAEPGTYLLAATYLESGGNWQLVGSSNHQNPIQIIVDAPELQPDPYEQNDFEGQAYSVPISFVNNTADLITNGANIHFIEDYDFYKLELPSGYDYAINCRTHDSYNSGNGQTYTNDVLWSYSIAGNWSPVYDDIMASNISVWNGGTVIFKVAPYFQGQTGTYEMDFSITRSPSTGIDDLAAIDMEIFPNPARNVLNVQFSGVQKVEEARILDSKGQLVRLVKFSTTKESIALNLDGISAGVYFISIRTEANHFVNKFMKAE